MMLAPCWLMLWDSYLVQVNAEAAQTVDQEEGLQADTAGSRYYLD